MKTIGLRILPLVLLALFSAEAFGQFSLSGELRPRFELRNGYKQLRTSTTNPAAFISQRSRLNVNYRQDQYEVRISLQDIRIWGNTPQLNTSDNLASIHEAWFRYYLCDNMSIQAGRQELVYDDHRIFGNVGWAQQGRSHDVARLRFEKKDAFKLHLGAAFNQSSGKLFGNLYDFAGNYKNMQFAWFNKSFGKVNLSLLALNNGLESTTKDSLGNVLSFETRYSQTFGGRIGYKSGTFQSHAASYFQTGKDVANRDLAGLYAAFDISKNLCKSTNVGIGMEHLSGTSARDIATKNNSFTPFYGTNHKFNGHMDYFYVGQHANNVGLNDIFVKVSQKYKNYKATATLHYFTAASDVVDPNNMNDNLDAPLGTELDLNISAKLKGGATCVVGYSFMNATETLSAIQMRGDVSKLNHWAYVMFTIKPTFFSTK